VGLFALSNHNRKPDNFYNAMLVAQEKLHPLLEKSLQCGSTWHDDLKNFHLGEGPQGLVNLSPAWFQQGHDVSAPIHGIYLLAAHSELDNNIKMPIGFYKLLFACCIGLARCHLRIQCNSECNPGNNSP